MVTVSEALEFTPKPANDGQKIYCQYIQMDFDGSELYNATVDLDLHVDFLYIKSPGRIPSLNTGDSHNISVEVHGSSVPEVEWRISDTSLHANDSTVHIGQYALFPTNEVGTNVYSSQFLIKNVSSEDGNKHFTILAKSKNGLSDEHEIRLSVDRPWPDDDDLPPESNPETAVIVVVSVIVVLILVIIVALTILYGKKTEKWCFKNSSPYIPPENQAQAEPLQSASSIIKHHPYGRPA